MRLTISIFLISIFFFSCKSKTEKPPPSVDSLLKRKISCVLNGEPANYDSAKHEGAWNAAYAYDYVYPKYFKDSSILVKDSIGDVTSDTSVLYSPDKHAVVKLWIGESISLHQDSIKADDILWVDKRIDSLISKINSSSYPYLKNISIDTLCHGINGSYHAIALIGHSASQTIIYKIEYSVLPATGDLISKNLVFAYDKDYKDIYHTVGITMANSFGFGRF